MALDMSRAEVVTALLTFSAAEVAAEKKAKASVGGKRAVGECEVAGGGWHVRRNMEMQCSGVLYWWPGELAWGPVEVSEPAVSWCAVGVGGRG